MFPPLKVPAPESGLAERLDARRRAGLSDPDWTMTPAERERQKELLEAVRAALDESRFGRSTGRDGETALRHRVLLKKAGLHLANEQMLADEYARLDRRLNGEQVEGRAIDAFSIVDPYTGRANGRRLTLPVSISVVAGAMAGAITDEPAAALCVVLTVMVTCGLATYRLIADKLRLFPTHLSFKDVVTIEPTAPSYPLARTVTNDVKTILSWPQGRSNDDNADLLAERDRIVVELVELDSRTKRLEAIAADTDEANANDHALLVRDVRHWHQHLAIAANEIAGQADSVRNEIAAADRELRRDRARAELDDLAVPPPRMIQDPDWRGDE